MNRIRKERLTKKIRDDIFLKELGKELREQEKDWQASPRYWGILNYRWVENTSNPERTSIYDSDACYSGEMSEFVKDIIEELDEEELKQKEEIIEDLNYYVKDNWSGMVLDILKEHFYEGELSLREESLEEYVIPCTMFLTKQEAKDHLKYNAHHYHRDASTYAMTAWRAPKVERLLSILEEF